MRKSFYFVTILMASIFFISCKPKSTSRDTAIIKDTINSAIFKLKTQKLSDTTMFAPNVALKMKDYQMKLSTDYLTWSDAERMMQAYATHKSALKVRHEDESIQVLKSLQIDANYLRAMLEDQSVQRVQLFFAVHKDDLSLPESQRTFTIITAPVIFDLTDRKYRLKKYRDVNSNHDDRSNSELIDFCDPCPKNCPELDQ